MSDLKSTATLLPGTVVVVGLAAWVAWPLTTERVNRDIAPAPPTLFAATHECPPGPRPRIRAERFELEGRLLAARAGYDPQDGVLAVARLRLAESCFLAADLPTHAKRPASMAKGLETAIEGDFAASRSALARTIEGGQWGLAEDPVKRLLRLTAHLGDHPYVSWLQTIAGKAAAHADSRN